MTVRPNFGCRLFLDIDRLAAPDSLHQKYTKKFFKNID